MFSPGDILKAPYFPQSRVRVLDPATAPKNYAGKLYTIEVVLDGGEGIGLGQRFTDRLPGPWELASPAIVSPKPAPEKAPEKAPERDLLYLFNHKALAAENTCRRCKGPLSYVGFSFTECVCDSYYAAEPETERQIDWNGDVTWIAYLDSGDESFSAEDPIRERAIEKVKHERDVFVQEKLRSPGNTRTG